jgi:hypothetical protein
MESSESAGYQPSQARRRAMELGDGHAEKRMATSLPERSKAATAMPLVSSQAQPKPGEEMSYSRRSLKTLSRVTLSAGFPSSSSISARVMPLRIRLTFASVTPGCHVSASVSGNASATNTISTPRNGDEREVCRDISS